MAYKSAAQTLLVWQKMVKAVDNLKTALGTFQTDYLAIQDAIQPDTVTVGFENDIQLAALRSMRDSLNESYNRGLAMIDTIHYSLGRLAASPDLGNRAMNLAYFQDKLVTDADELESRGLTKFSSFSLGGSNVGNGKFVLYGSDSAGQVMDIAHPQTLTLSCERDAFSGDQRTVEGNEKFRIKGESPNFEFPWVEAGSGMGVGYQYPNYGLATNEWGPDMQSATDGYLSAISGNQSTGNVIRGDFENSFSAMTANEQSFTDGWISTSGYDKITFVDTSAAPTAMLKGNGCIKITGNCKFRYPLTGSTQARSKAAMFLSLRTYKFISSSTLTGTLTVKVIDDSTTHGTLTVTVGSLTDNTKTHNTPVAFILPANIGANLRVEIEMASYFDGSGSSNYLLLDEAVLGRMKLIDGGYAVGIAAGLVPFRKGDYAYGATTDAASGRLQFYANKVWGRFFRHAGTADFWEDPA